MSKKPVMSHDPLAELDDASLGESVEVPAELKKQEGAQEATAGGLRLPESLTIAQVAECHAEWLEYIQQVDETVIDGSTVEQIDGAGLQLLAAMVKDTVGSAGRVRWSGHSEILLSGARTLGLVSALCLDEEAGPTQGGA